MASNKQLSNQELLAELEKRLVNDTFSRNDSVKLINLLGKYQQQFLSILHAANPQVYQWCQDKIQEKEQEETEQKVKAIQKSLENQKKK